MSDTKEINFQKLDGLVPAIIQDNRTGKVLMLGFMNKEAYEKTKQEKIVTFYSRSKQRLWTKGETSGNFLRVESIFVDCDQDTLLIKAIPNGPACHTGAVTCFHEQPLEGKAAFLDYLKAIIHDRKTNPTESSYTNSLFQRGINKVAQKVGEEAVEVVIEAKDNNDELFKNEVADLLFHLLVLLEAKEVTLDAVVDVLIDRHSSK